MKKFITITVLMFFVFSMNAQNFGAANKSAKVNLNTTHFNTDLKPQLKTAKGIYINETFDTEIPATWTIVNNGTGQGWLWTGGTPYIDSDDGGSGTHESAELISPSIDASAAANLTLAFDSYYNNQGSDRAYIDVWDGSAWVTLVEFTADHGNSATAMEHFEYDISAYAGSDLQIRFNYDDMDSWAWYWYIDNVVVLEQENHDLGVDTISPSFVLSGETVTPQVTIHNYGISDEPIWDVTLTDGDTYSETISNLSTITSGSDLVIDFPNNELSITCDVETVTDLGVDAISPSFVFSGETVTPQVTIHNYGLSDEVTWDVTLTDGDTYSETISNLSTITSGSDLVIDFPTATVTVADDGNLSNNELSINCDVVAVTYDAMAYGGNTTAGEYGTYDLENGGLTPTGTIGGSPFPMAEEYNGTFIYRINDDLTINIVLADGTPFTTNTITGVTGTPTGLAWDWANEIMYMIVLNGSDLPQLGTLDLETFVFTEIGVGTMMIIAMDMANDGYLYGPAMNDESLYQIDPATGANNLVGASGLIDINFGQDVSYDTVNNRLYSITCGAEYLFGYYDLETGAFTELADTDEQQYGTFVITGISTNTYTVTFNVNGDNGTLIAEVDDVEITSGDEIEEGKNVVFTATADAGYQIKEWTVNSEVVTDYTESVYTVEDLSDVMSATVEFEINTGIENRLESEIVMYPNPARSTATIISETKINEISVFSVVGNIILNESVVNNKQYNLNVSALNSGIYFIKIVTDNGIVTKRLQIN